MLHTPLRAGPLDRPINLTFFKDRGATVKKDAALSMLELAERIRKRSAASKEALPWLKLATFGGRKTDKGSLRNNDNLLAVTGVELDYDKGAIQLADACDLIAKANVCALVYTSPSHQAAFPKWRILAPFSEAMDRRARAQMAGRIAGIFYGYYGENVFDPASWTDSQSYFYGRIADRDPRLHQVVALDGEEIDLHDDLDETSVGKPNTAPRYRDSSEPAEPGERQPLDIEAVERAILTGDNYHNSLHSLAGKRVGQGADRDEVIAELEELLNNVPIKVQQATHKRWKRAMRGIPASVDYCLKEEAKHLFRDYDRSEEPGDETVADEPEESDGQGKSEEEKVEETEAGHDDLDDMAAAIEEDIPERPWLIPRLAMRGALTAIVAPGAAGKSTLTTHIAIMGANGGSWGPWTARQNLRVLYINLEDDRNERKRRFKAATIAMKCGIPPGMIRAMRIESLTVARINSITRAVIRTPKLAELRALVAEGRYDLIIVDPFVETHEANENDNVQIKTVASLWRELARETGVAIILVHHARKGSAENGNEAEMSRGASSLINMCRCAVYMAIMKPDEAIALGLPENEAKLYVSASDSMKQNYAAPADRLPWFRHDGVLIGNGKLTREGDSVGVLTPWDKPKAFDGLDNKTLNRILDAISKGLTGEDGNPTGQLYTAKPQRWKDANWAGKLVVVAGRSAVQAKEVLQAWLDSGLIVEDKLYKSYDHKPRTGLRVVDASRPGTTS